ncbi:MAG TPA: Dot/Icm T4SS effector Zinc-dependent metalloprotease LegP [Kineosporiaceae bacterium]|nr:Dot/Icm T4SS effector Zinc-dependent metalloprotease LegP [Kineosporiaceae bacterium]
MADDETRASDEQLAASNQGFQSSGDVRTGFISGATFERKAVQYEAVGDLAFFEGDICLGTVAALERSTGLVQASAAGDVSSDDPLIAHGVVITGSQYRWPGALMPYEIDNALPNKQRVTDAIAHWQAHTNMRFVQRTAANASQYPNYVRVFPGDGCWSFVGMQGGRQDLSLADGCGFGAAVHEFGHAWGLWHEQSREDRDSYITINWQNIEAGREHNFNQHISDGDDVGAYDYGSIMHYGAYAFSKNGQPTIVPKQSGVTIGQRNGLSAGDIAAVHHIYRTLHLNLTVTLAYATPHSKNAWVSFAGLGWRKIDPNAPAGVTNTLELLAVSRATGRTVHAELDGNTIYAAYGN